MTDSVQLHSRRPSPAARPQPITFVDDTLWVGCWETPKLFAIDPKTWTTREEIALPGIPYGIAWHGGLLHVVVSIGEADDRYIYTMTPGKTPTDADRTPCPDLTGSHLTSDGVSLYLVQQTHRQVLKLGQDGSVVRTIPLPTRSAGIGFAGSACRMISADAEFDVLEFATFDIASPEPHLEKLAPMDVESRGLAYDGTQWWTSYRELSEIVSFAV